jgi:dihydropteroate synthase
MIWQCGATRFDVSRSPIVMGILNVTADSFSDGGKFLVHERAVEHALRMRDEGAAIIDIGGESTRPGARPINESEELERIVPLVEALVQQGVVVSVDTQKASVMRAAIAAGASVINDVNALQANGARQICAASDVGVVLMHKQGTPQTMQVAPIYEDVVRDVQSFLLTQARACEAVGIQRQRIAIDPGIGFGKTVEHNVALLKATHLLSTMGYPLLIGVSRKSMFKALLNREVDQRLAGSLATALLTIQRGARILRVHDVAQTVDALKMLEIFETQSFKTPSSLT